MFHIIAGVAFVGLFVGLGRLQRQRDMLRFYLRTAARDQVALGRIQVDWPIAHLVKFGRCLGISVRGNGNLQWGDPRKIDAGKILRLYLEQGLSAVDYKVPEAPGEKPSVAVTLTHKSEAAEALLDEIASDLKIHVTLADGPVVQ